MKKTLKFAFLAAFMLITKVNATLTALQEAIVKNQ